MIEKDCIDYINNLRSPCAYFSKAVSMVAALSNISNIIIPVIIFYIVAYGIAARSNVYEDFIKGARDGFHTDARQCRPSVTRPRLHIRIRSW